MQLASTSLASPLPASLAYPFPAAQPCGAQPTASCIPLPAAT
jgi:hypothetical protein